MGLTFPVLPARFVEVHVGVDEPRRYDQVPVVQNVLKAKLECGCCRQVGLTSGTTEDGDAGNQAVLDFHCGRMESAQGNGAGDDNVCFQAY